MIEKFLSGGNFELLQKSIEDGQNCSVFGLNNGEKLALVEDSAKLFYIVENADNISNIYDCMVAIGKTPVIITSIPNVFSSEFDNCEDIIESLYQLKMGVIDTVIMTPNVMFSNLPSLDKITKLTLNVGEELEVSKFIKTLIDMGYKRVDLVVDKGDFSVRGDVVDIYPLCGKPTRIMVDYDTIDTIKYYNPVTMLTTVDAKYIDILSNVFYRVENGDIDKFYTNKGIKKDEFYLDITSNIGRDYRLIAFDNCINSSIFDYMSDAVVVFDGARNISNAIKDYVDNFNQKISSLSGSFRKIMSECTLSINKCKTSYEKHTLLAFHYINESNRLFTPNKVFTIRTLPSMNYYNYMSALTLDMSNFSGLGYTVILCAGGDEEANKLKGILDKSRIASAVYLRLSMCNKNSINIVTKNYPLDVLLPEEKLIIVSTSNLIGKRRKVIEINHNSFDAELPKENDYIVHNFHGVGRCLGVKTLTLTDGQRDYVVIEYKNNDKLYLPVENIDQISKYVGSDKEPTLNKIGGVEFAKTKERVKASVKKIAFDLIGLYRERLNLKGYKYPKDDELQLKFENDFGYSETTDQLTAINDCKADMESGKVMDRLICGDVGFGKTEVALRIAFKTILSGKQVALLCPTTILSEQHYNTATARMSDFGIKIAVLNRLKTPKEIEKIKSDFKQRKIDMICGTHKLLANDIDYSNLGLLILDEEQKFGVSDKEKLKDIKKNINVITLSATPIPRTLNMGLIGVRDISVIETPPTERISSDVQVVEYSNDIVVSAINREIERGGQVLIIYNRVETIYSFASAIKQLVPSVTLSVAHGQMTDVELEEEIFKLYSGKTQVLVATTLIENGVDLPNANTLIVVNSDNLGLSQLYQLKGRIGRSNKSSFAYFTFDNRKELTENAYKRLQAIKEFSEMGSGFKIAMRDLEIRGAGSLLGAEQSGHIEKIGYNLYVELLNDSVKELKGENVDKKYDIRVESKLPAYLSHNYVESSTSRMKMYRDISMLDTLGKMIEFIKNTTSIYGDIPLEFLNLIKIGFIKNLCGKIGANKILIGKVTRIYLNGKENISKNIIDSLNEYGDCIRLDLSTSPLIEISSVADKDILEFVINYLQQIIG